MTGTRRKRPSISRREDATNGDAAQLQQPPVAPALSSRQFELPNGTVITFGANVDAIHMPAEDRKIFFGILEQLERYGEPSEPERPEEADEAEVAEADS